jgi:hypothetical protein
MSQDYRTQVYDHICEMLVNEDGIRKLSQADVALIFDLIEQSQSDYTAETLCREIALSQLSQDFD